ncbi:MAG: chlorophyll synthesis pathway protein BchC [Sinobacteraceae bacterium]|nr:chlorophyll synthesis pathway protein BchC [Nevskiaceae bacterium]
MSRGWHAHAVVIEGPERLSVDRLALQLPTDDDVVVDTEWSGISSGTERLLWSGRMPAFPGMGYPLVPGYESIGRISAVGRAGDPTRIGERVFVPGARCFGEVRGLFGGAASRLVVPAARVTRVDESLGDNAILLALAATAYHALAAPGARAPELIVGHGVLGRLLARLCIAVFGSRPTVWERSVTRMQGMQAYPVCSPDIDQRRDYNSIYDVSGDASILDQLVGRIAHGGEVVLAGFYVEPLSFTFTQAFMREARIRVAAEWKDTDLAAVNELCASGRLSLDGLITHRQSPQQAAAAYQQAFGDPECLKMVIDWRSAA